MEPVDVETRLTRALAQLPSPVAPDTLLPRVMQGLVDRRQARWYRRAWRQWPLAWQAASVVAAVAVVAAGVGQPGVIGAWAGRDITVATEPVQRVTSQVEPTVAALQILWRVVVEPIAPMLVGIVMAMGTACVVIGLTFNYLVAGRTRQR